MQKYDITGMSCAACSARVQKAVEGVKGVNECSVNLLTNSMTVVGTANSADIISAVQRGGYGAALADEREKDKTTEMESKNPFKARFLWSLVILLVLMYISMGHSMLSLPLPAFLAGRTANGFTQMLLCIAVMVINIRFFISGIKGVLHLAPNMDTLVSLGALASFGYSAVLYKTAAETGFKGDFYFESAAMILTLITLGKMLEARAKGKTTNALSALKKLAPDTATVIRDGQSMSIPVSEISVGDIVAVRPGESIAVDGVVVKGQSAADQSALTGESIPVDKSIGDTVFSGTVNLTGYIEFKAQAVGEDTALGRVIKTVSEAAAGKAPIAKIADKVAGVFVPFVLMISVLTMAVWLIIGAAIPAALNFSISVLVISCPCALGLATPVAIMVSAGVGAKHGILYKNAAAIEQTGKCGIIALDKTGTVTTGKPSVTDIFPADNISEDELLSLGFSLEYKSEHPLARAVVDFCREKDVRLTEAEEFAAVVGGGVKGLVSGEAAFGGNAGFIGENADLSAEIKCKAADMAKAGKTPLLFSKAGRVYGIIAVADSVKEEVPESVSALRKMGLQVIMLTGDNPLTAAATATAAGVDEFRAELLPDEKAKIINELKAEGKVLMVGDGINDAPALTVADIGVAIGAGTDIAIDSADVVLVKSDFADLVSAVKLSRTAYRNIKQNLFWAFFYNAVCIPLAAGVFSPLGIVMSPMIGAAAMSMSSLCVVSNALRIKTFVPFRAAKTSSGGEKNMTVKVKGIMCEHCEARIKAAIESVKGVKSAKVSKDTGTAEVETDGEADKNLIFEAIKAAGYEIG